ncbi:histidine phosphatase family protein [Promethearchaeum syntrophicum]|uniref:Histidine phosphatase family protein n=1 Tax=Promethearchaeum syntrophicum TaxID=2594042 RepID=A0A5B9DDY3_9ARCH|nr:histidine phosphatase family protein [Candidatus Prometheoarchaeum syntrophicum]
MNTLKSVSWGKNAIQLLNLLNNGGLMENVPTILMLRHSEREEPEILEEIFEAPLTERGHKAAFEFGMNLPKKYEYRFFHSSVPRCKNTALEIRKGISNSKQKNSISIESIESLIKINCDFEKFKTYLRQTETDTIFLDRWIGQFYNPLEIEPALAVAKRIAKDIKKLNKTQKKKTIDVFVSHDFHVILSQFYLSGNLVTNEWIQYLDGFIIQFFDKKMKIYSQRGKVEVNYPYWWTN